jgi:hypothetical protein
MVEYYKDLWMNGSDMFATLTSLVGECGHTKVTKALKTKRSLGIGTRYIKKHSLA